QNLGTNLYSRMVDATTVRNLIAFWLFGLCNNYAYVIMLSAAGDIIDQQTGVQTTPKNDTNVCVKEITGRDCDAVSTGAILLADIIPSLAIKATFPFFMQRIPFGFRMIVVILFQTGSYLMVAFSVNMPMSIAGVVFASVCSGLGEITLLSLTSFYPKSMISAWSSGTGGAGVVGSFAYAALTEPSLGNLTPTNALLVMLVVPLLFAVSYWLLLKMPETVYSPGFNPTSWIVPLNHADNHSNDEKSSPQQIDVLRISVRDEGDDYIPDQELSSYDLARSDEAIIDSAKVPQRPLSMKEKFLLVIPLLKYMIPLALVYFGEYVINQGIVQLIFFNCDSGFGMSKSSQYRWYQVLYQVGVFISRSSVSFVQLPPIVLYILPVLQLANAIFFFFDALYFFVPHIAILFVLIIIEGLLGGAAYVNTFNNLHKEVAPDIREYSISVASASDSFGIVVSGLLSIPIHNFICSQPLPGIPAS
ncbi:hypothetical protein PFISCL1PPCAC_19111, partial [Pristionchus fissidentatus]